MASHNPAIHLQDIILGGQDGLVNVLGISLGVFASTGDVQFVIVSGLAAMFAESISMGACAYTSTKAAVHYEVKDAKDAGFTKKEAEKILAKSDLAGQKLAFAKRRLTSHLEDGGSMGPLTKGAKVWISTMLGSAIPLAPYFFINDVALAAGVSIAVSGIVLFGTGALKAKMTVGDWKGSGAEMLLVGALAAIAGYVIGSILKVGAV
jgi:VIT1/CCC1 family predicted Fe2+/Mn2+ transporter